MSSVRSLVISFIVFTVLGLWLGIADAGHFTGACSAELNAVEQAINDGEFLGNKASTDQSNLLVKLQAAAGKLSLQKFSDAVDKLQDISDTATALATAPKPKLRDATTINDAVIDAIACVPVL